MGMNPGMSGMGMTGMNPGMGMGMNPGMSGMGMTGMNPGMMNPMALGGGFNPMAMQSQMTPAQLEELKKQRRYQGYLMGKKLAEEKKKAQGKSTETSSDNVSTPISPETEIKIKFNKSGSVEEVKMKAGSMIAELLSEYYEKTKHQGPFKYKGNTLKSDDCSTLLDIGMKNCDEITVG